MTFSQAALLRVKESLSVVDFLSSIDISSLLSPGSVDRSDDFFSITESELSIDVTSTEIFPASSSEEESFFISIEPTQSSSFVFGMLSSFMMTDSSGDIFLSSSIESEESPSFADFLSSVDTSSTISPGSGDGSGDFFSITESVLSIEITPTESFPISPTPSLEEESFFISTEPSQRSTFVFGMLSSFMMTDSSSALFPISSTESEESPSFVDFFSSVDISPFSSLDSFDGSGDFFSITESVLSIAITATESFLISPTPSLEEESFFNSIEPSQSSSFVFGVISSFMLTDSSSDIFPSSSIESEESPSFVDFFSGVDISASVSPGSGVGSGDFFSPTEPELSIEVTSFEISPTSSLEDEGFFISIKPTQSSSSAFGMLSSFMRTDFSSDIFPSNSIDSEESPSFADFLSSVDISSTISPGSGDGSGDFFSITESVSIEITPTESFPISPTPSLEEESVFISSEPTQSSSFVFGLLSSLIMTDSTTLQSFFNSMTPFPSSNFFPRSSTESEESPSFVDFLSSVAISSFISPDFFSITESLLSIEITATESFPVSPTSSFEEDFFFNPTQSSLFVFEQSTSFMMTDSITSPGSAGSSNFFSNTESVLSIIVTESFPSSSTSISLEEESVVISIEPTPSSSFVTGLLSSLMMTSIQTLLVSITPVDSTVTIAIPTPSDFLGGIGDSSIQSLESILSDSSVEFELTLSQIGSSFSSSDLFSTDNRNRMTEVFPSETIASSSQLILSSSEFETFISSVLSIEPAASSNMFILTSESVSRSLNSSSVLFSDLDMTKTISSLEFDFIPTSLVISSTMLVVSEAFLPSPMPTPLICDPPKESQPIFPLNVRMVGYGLLNQVVGNGIINQSIPAANSVDYLATVSAIARPDKTQNTGEIQIVLQGDILTSATFSRVVNTSSLYINGTLSRSEIYSDSQPITAVVQVRDGSFSTDFEVNVIISLRIISRNSVVLYNCLTVKPSGLCTVRLSDIPSYWFLPGSNNNVSVTVSIAGTSTTEQLGYLNLKATLPQVPLPLNTIYAIVPSCSIEAGKEIDIEVYATYGTLIFGFSLDCILGGPAVIKDARASLEWSLLSDFLNSSNERIAVTGFRNYNKSNTGATGMVPDHLFNLTISTTEDFVNASNNLLKCNAVKLSFTNRTELQNTISVAVISHEGACMGYLPFTSPMLIDIFAYAEQTELLNVMSHTVLNNTEVLLHLVGFNGNGSLSPFIYRALCSSLDTDIIQVYSNCSAVFFNGDENSGSERVGIMISYENIHKSIIFKVWYVNNIELEVEDRELNVISTVCSGRRYQSTPVLITAFAITDIGSSPHPVSLTDYLLAYLISSRETIATVSDGKVVGISEGTVNISLQSMVSTSVQVSVSDIPVCVYFLDVVSFSDVSLEVTDMLDDQLRPIVTLSLLQNFQYIRSTLILVGVAIFSDGHRMRIYEAEEIDFQIDHPEVVSEKGLGHFVIQIPLPLITITTTWKFADCEIIRNELTLTTNVGVLPQLDIKLSRSVLTYPDDPATSFGITSSLQLEVSLIYPNNYTIQVPINDSSLKIVLSEGVLLIQDLVTVSRNITISGVAIIRANYSVGADVLCDSAEVIIKHATNLILTAYVSNTAEIVTELKQVGVSGMYQEAQLQGRLEFNDGTTEDVTLMTAFRALSPTNLISIISHRLKNDHMIVIDALYVSSHDLIIQGMLQLESNTTYVIGNLSITVTNESVQVRSIDDIILTLSSIINKVFINCFVSLDDGTQLNKTFQDGIPLYPSLIDFRTDDTDQLFIQLDTAGMGTFLMIKNSFNTIYLTAASNGIRKNVAFYSNLRAGLGEVDLGDDGIESRSLQDVEANQHFKVPVILNSNETAVGVYKLSVLFEPADALVLDRVIQGENWLNGSLVYFGSKALVTVSGILITGARSSSIRLADIFFTACMSCNCIVNFTANVSYLSEANIALQDIQTFASTASETQMRIVPVQNRKRRSIENVKLTGRQKRQINTNCMMVYPTDYNQDCLVDLRDLYLLQVYVAAATLNFSTATGSQIRSIVGVIDTSINQFAAIERNSLDISFTVTDINYQLYFDPSLHCNQQINGVVQSSYVPVINANIHLLLAFTSNDPTFLSNFSNYNFTGAVVDPAKGILDAEFTEINGSTIFQISGNAFLTEDFELSIIVVVDTGEPSNNFIDLADSFYANVVATFNISNVDDRCTPVTQIHTTVMPTTARGTTAITTDATSITTTKVETTAMTAKAVTTVMIMERTTTMATKTVTTAMNTAETTVMATAKKDVTIAVNTEGTTTDITTANEITDASSTPSNSIGIIFGVMSAVAIVIIVLIVVTIFLTRRQRKQKNKYSPGSSERGNRTSNNFWCGEERQIVSLL